MLRSFSTTLTVGVGGTAAGNLGVPFPCKLRSVRLVYGGGHNMDVSLANMGRTMLTVAAAHADRVVNPTEPLHDSAGVAVASTVAGGPQLTPPTVHGTIAVTVANATAGDTVTVVCVVGVG